MALGPQAHSGKAYLCAVVIANRPRRLCARATARYAFLVGWPRLRGRDAPDFLTVVLGLRGGIVFAKPPDSHAVEAGPDGNHDVGNDGDRADHAMIDKKRKRVVLLHRADLVAGVARSVCHKDADERVRDDVIRAREPGRRNDYRQQTRHALTARSRASFRHQRRVNPIRRERRRLLRCPPVLECMCGAQASGSKRTCLCAELHCP